MGDERYENLRRNLDEYLTDPILGWGYGNNGTDLYTSDELLIMDLRLAFDELKEKNRFKNWLLTLLIIIIILLLIIL